MLHFNPIRRRKIRVTSRGKGPCFYGLNLDVRREQWPKRRITAWCVQQNYIYEDSRDHWWNRANDRRTSFV